MRVAPAVTLALTLLVAGCAGDEEDGASSEARSTSSSSTSSGEEKTSEDAATSESDGTVLGDRASTTVEDLSATSLADGYAEAYPDERGKTLTCDEGLEPEIGAQTDCIVTGPDDTWGGQCDPGGPGRRRVRGGLPRHPPEHTEDRGAVRSHVPLVARR